MKKSRIEDSEVELAEELKMVPPDLFEKYGEFYVICGNMPAETESNNLREFLEQFGQIQYLWLENQNGQCSRQAMVFFSSQEELENSIQSKTQIFNSFTITIELCKQELKQLSQQFFLLNNEKKIEIQKNNAQQFLDQDIIRHIRDILTKINTNRIESKNLQRILPSLSPNDLLMTKYACAILSNIIYFFPTSAFVAQKCKIPNQLMNLLQTLPIDCVNHHHIVVLSDVIQGSDRELKQDLKMNGGLQTLSHLLEHTNLNVKSDSIQLMMNILNSEERYEKRVSHPLFTNLQRSGVIFQIYQCGLIHGKTEDDINNSAIVLGILLKAQEVDQNMKKSLIQQIKAMIGEQNNPKLVANALDMICGLAVRKSNINEIVSDKFIQTISELSKCHDTNLKSYVLELLLILIDSGGTELEKEIINSVDIVKFLELIGDSDSYLDEQILIRVMKWSKDVQILNIQNLFEELKRFNIANEEQKKKILSSNIIPTILSHLNITNEQIVELNENNELIPTQTIGLINSCCVSLVSVSDHNEESAIEIIKTGILTQLQILLQHVPLEQVKSIHLRALCNLTEIISFNRNRYLFQIGTVQMLIRFFEHPSSSVALLAALIICNIINSGMKYQSTQIGYTLELPIFVQHPYFDQLKQDNILITLEQIALSHKINEDITQQLITSLIYSYRIYPFPSSLLNLAISWLKSQIEGKLEANENIQNEIFYLHQLSQNKTNHETILNSGIIKILSNNINHLELTSQVDILNLFIVLFDCGEENIRQHIKQSVSLELLQCLIKRNQFVNLFFASNDIRQQQQLQIALNNYFVFASSFTLLTWIKEQNKMIILAQLRNEVSQLIKTQKLKENNQLSQKQKYQPNNIRNNQNQVNENNTIILEPQFSFMNQNSNNEWEIIQKMIQNVINIKDKDLASGAMGIIRESIYLVLFEQLKNKKEESLLNTIECFQQLIDRIDYFVCFNLIDENISFWLRIIIKESKQKEKLIVLEKIISLLASILKRGSLMGKYYDINHFFILYQDDLLQLLKQTVEEELNIEQIEGIKQMKERIRLKSAICLCCLEKNRSINEKYLKICSSIFQSKLVEFNLKLQQNSSSNENEVKLDSKQIELIHNILTSLFCLVIESNNSQIIFNQYKMHEVILPLIHINCSCILSVDIPNSILNTDLVSLTFSILSKLIHAMTPKLINELNSQHNILSHLIPFIFTYSEQNINLNASSATQSIGTNQYLQYTNKYYNQTSTALTLFSEMINKSEQIKQSVKKDPNFINKILQQIKNIQMNKFQTTECSEIQFRSLELINSINMNSSPDHINWMIHKLNLLQIISLLMSTSGCQGSDDDDVLSENISNIFSVLENLKKKRNDQQSKQLSNEIKDKFEEDGLVQENDAHIFHSDNRSNVGVKGKAVALKKKMNL